jgi:hypothetical protein
VRRSFVTVALLAGLIPGPASAALVGCSEAALRAAITAVNGGATADTTITIPGNCTITLTGAAGDDANASGDLRLTASMTIEGAGAASTIIDGGGVDRIFDVSNGPPDVTVTISGLTIRNGAASVGAGILNGRTLTLVDSVVRGNSTTLGSGAGGGVNTFGTMTVARAIITENVSLTAGGIRTRSVS